MAFTYFFRDLQTIELAVKYLLPYTAGRSRNRIWDAGCAMGPEPYSLAIILAENMGHFAFKNVHIDATDIDGSNLFGPIISEGVFPKAEVKRVPKLIFEKYFHQFNGDDRFQIDYNLRNRITFQKHDLLSLKPIGDGFSLVMCKNVLLHFKYEQRVEVIKMFHKALAKGGLLAMEQTQKLPDELTPFFEQTAKEGQIYRKIEVKL